MPNVFSALEDLTCSGIEKVLIYFIHLLQKNFEIKTKMKHKTLKLFGDQACKANESYGNDLSLVNGHSDSRQKVSRILMQAIEYFNSFLYYSGDIKPLDKS